VPFSKMKLGQQAPELLSLAKRARLTLGQHGLERQRAKVALCLDHSGSMRSVYSAGRYKRWPSASSPWPRSSMMTAQ